jgi:hypothetical protein
MFVMGRAMEPGNPGGDGTLPTQAWELKDNDGSSAGLCL